MELQHNKHCVGEASFHIVFSPKYRHGIFGYKRLRTFCIHLFMIVADRHGLTIRALEVMDNHVHLFVSIEAIHSISQVVRYFKGYSAYKIFRTFPWLKEYKPGEKRFWGGHFWSRGYFYRSVGSTTDKAVEFYIKVTQNKQLKEKYYTSVGTRKQQGISDDPYLDYCQGKIDINKMDLYFAALKKGQTKLDIF